MIKPVIVITSKKTLYFPSIADAVEALGISKQRLLRGLADPEGRIPRTWPVMFIDEAVDDEEHIP